VPPALVVKAQADGQAGIKFNAAGRHPEILVGPAAETRIGFDFPNPSGEVLHQRPIAGGHAVLGRFIRGIDFPAFLAFAPAGAVVIADDDQTVTARLSRIGNQVLRHDIEDFGIAGAGLIFLIIQQDSLAIDHREIFWMLRKEFLQFRFLGIFAEQQDRQNMSADRDAAGA